VHLSCHFYIFQRLCFFQLRIPDEEQPQFSIYRTEIGRFALGKALTDEKLFRLCEEEGDSKGNLRFLVVSFYVPIHGAASQTEKAAGRDVLSKSELGHVSLLGPRPRPPTEGSHIRALSVSARNNFSNSDEQAKPLQTSKQPRYGPMPDASMSLQNAALRQPHVPPPAILSVEATRLNAAMKPVLGQHGREKEQTIMQITQPQVSLPLIPPSPTRSYELRLGTGVGAGTDISTGIVPPPPPPHTRLSQWQGPWSSVPQAPTNVPLATSALIALGSDDSQSDAGTLWNIRPTAKKDSMTGANISTDNIWAAPPMAGTHVSRTPQLTATSEEGRDSASLGKKLSSGYTTLAPAEVSPLSQGPSPSSLRAGVGSQRMQMGQRSERAEAPEPSWGSRPDPGGIMELIEQYFPDHELDKPVIEASPGGTSPMATELPFFAPAQDRRQRKKTIRIRARERMSQRRKDSDLASDDSFANKLARKRSTKLWSSRVEEVTPVRIKADIACAPMREFRSLVLRGAIRQG
jgi:hypothetical protein